MKINKSIIFFTSLFILCCAVLALLKIVPFSLSLIIGVIFQVSGISLVFRSFGTGKRGKIFAGSSVFLLGLVFFLDNFFEFQRPSELVFPIVLLIISVSFLVLFIDTPSIKLFLYFFLLFFVFGILFSINFGNLSLNSFLLSIIEVLKHFWIIIILIIGLLIFLKR